MWYSKNSSLKMLEHRYSHHLIELLNLSPTLYVVILLFQLQLLELVPLALLLSLRLWLEERKEKRLLKEKEELSENLRKLKRKNDLKERRGELLGEEVLEEVRLSILAKVLGVPRESLSRRRMAGE